MCNTIYFLTCEIIGVIYGGGGVSGGIFVIRDLL